ncbi:MAG TPA: hypothetical protein VGM84_11940 [Steroidobacteraceae bacterium]|jgi:hypothetical protein
MDMPIPGQQIARHTRAAILALVVLGAAQTASAGSQPSGVAYPQMRPGAEYLMPSRAAEISLARSAAPAAISESATVLVLSSKGYETAVKGTNGFTCLVERAWMSPFDSPEFWNPKLRGPVCYNPAATRSILPITRYRTKLAQAGTPKMRMFDEIRVAIARKELPALEPGAMSFMMSKDGYLSDDAGHWHSHLMFYIAGTDTSSWGANLPGSPVVVDDEHRKIPEQQIIFLVPVSRWSDGSFAPAAGHAAEN